MLLLFLNIRERDFFFCIQKNTLWDKLYRSLEISRTLYLQKQIKRLKKVFKYIHKGGIDRVKDKRSGNTCKFLCYNNTFFFDVFDAFFYTLFIKCL